MAPLTVKGCGEVVEWFCTVRSKDNAALTRANADGYIYVWTQTGKSNKRKVDGSETEKESGSTQTTVERMAIFVSQGPILRNQWFKYGAYFSLWKLDKDAPRTNNACEIYHAHTQRYFTPGAYLGQWVHQFRVVQNAEQNYCMDLLEANQSSIASRLSTQALQISSTNARKCSRVQFLTRVEKSSSEAKYRDFSPEQESFWGSSRQLWNVYRT
ncbi:hypothetical protein DdX_03486 [Ditylenchus destructor]|uniref:Uncharacterized protein n=1 Tax=Ditylenchus destructor TaxID=166010 RepID=A0AAD4N8V5_9BILA|nr:hypothetical protein DdX_03486 [Ditylenchus destructor]